MKRFVYFLAVLIAFTTVTSAQKTQVVYDAIKGEPVEYNDFIKVNPDLSTYKLNSAVQPSFGIYDMSKNNTKENLPGFLLPEFQPFAMGYPIDQSDSAYIWPKADVADGEFWTSTGLWEFPAQFMYEGQFFYGVTQFFDGIAGTFNVDSMYVGFFAPNWDGWDDVQEDFYLIPIKLLNSGFGTEDYNGINFDFNNDQDTKWEFLDDNHQAVPISSTQINEAHDIANGNVKYLKVFFDPPLVINPYEDFGFVVVPQTFQPTTNPYRWFGAYEWELDADEVRGSFIVKYNNNDTIQNCTSVVRTWNQQAIVENYGQATWDRLNAALHSKPIKTDYKFTLFGMAEPTSVRQESSDPAPFELQQNWPNPVSDETKIKFSVQDASYITLKVYNQLGQLVATLADEYYNPGSFEASLDASNLPIGTYFYTITAGKHTATKAMQVVR